MTERLKELMLEAGYAAPEIAGRANKLAELIVEECCKIMEARKYADPDDSAEHYVNQGLATGVSLIKQHFGVE